MLSYSQFRFYRLLCIGTPPCRNETTPFLSTGMQPVISNPGKAAFDIIGGMRSLMYLQQMSPHVVFSSQLRQRLEEEERQRRAAVSMGGAASLVLIIGF